jgi:HEPN domain-containing protein
MSSAAPANANATELLTARRLIVEASEAASRGDDISVRLAVLVADLAAETLLKAALRHFARRVDPDSKFKELLKEVISAPVPSGPDLSFVSLLWPLRTMRNAVMHDGTSQDVHATRARVSQARDVLTRLARDAFDVDLMNLRANDFVRIPTVKRFLDQAVERLEHKNYFEAAALSVAAFDELLSKWAALHFAFFYPGRSADSEIVKFVAAAGAGIYLPDLARFRDATRDAFPQVAESGKTQFVDRGWSECRSEELRDRDARFAVDFVGSVSLQLEARIGAEVQSFPRW